MLVYYVLEEEVYYIYDKVSIRDEKDVYIRKRISD
jgi:hypothetical protein